MQLISLLSVSSSAVPTYVALLDSLWVPCVLFVGSTGASQMRSPGCTFWLLVAPLRALPGLHRKFGSP